MPHRFLIFGGTFDPPHLAHATLPPIAAMALGCDRVIYVPAAVSPLKTDSTSSPAHHRLAMLKLALRDVTSADISTIEMDRHGPSYTIDTLRELKRQHPAAELRLLIGSDQALEFHRWKEWQEILKLATPAVMLRPPLTRETFRRGLLRQTAPQDADRWLSWTVDLPPMDISATQIRQRLAAGEDLAGLVDPRVEEYIRERRLYGAR